jgi:hypothetical protein
MATEVVDSTGAINVVLVGGVVSDPGALVVEAGADVVDGVTVMTAVGEAVAGSVVGSSVVQARRVATRATASARVVGRRRCIGRVGARRAPLDSMRVKPNTVGPLHGHRWGLLPGCPPRMP